MMSWSKFKLTLLTVNIKRSKYKQVDNGLKDEWMYCIHHRMGQGEAYRSIKTSFSTAS